VSGSGRTVTDKWDACWVELNEEPFVRVFGTKNSRTCRARYERIVDEQSKKDGQAQRDSGAGTADSGPEDEEEKRTLADLVRAVDK